MSAVAHNFISVVGDGFQPEPEENVFDTLFSQYEKVVFQSLITSFGLDAFIKDQHGGDVDTVHNVRNGVEYKNADNKAAYENQEPYNDYQYHRGNDDYKATISKTRAEANNGVTKDEYTDGILAFSKAAPPNVKAALDHVIAAKKIHDDKGRVLSGLNGTELANSPENLKFTNASLNSSMRADEIPEYIAKHPELPDDTKAKMMEHYKNAKKSYDRKINIAYYTSKGFWKDTGSAAANLGAQMGLRQVLGLVMSEVWFAVKDAMASAPDGFEAKIKAIAAGIKLGFINAKEKYRTLLAKFGEGAVSGVLSSLSTTLCNIFFTTAKNIVRIIRLTWASIVEATSIIIFNPDDLPFSERMRAVLKIVATGASVVLGATVQEAVHAALQPYGGLLPGLNTLVDIVSVFAGSLCTGVLTVSLLYLIDSDPFNSVLTKEIDSAIRSYKAQAQLFREYAAKLANLDISKFEQEAALYHSLALNIETAQSANELNAILQQAMKQIGISIPWGDRSFNEFMRDPNAVLHFGA